MFIQSLLSNVIKFKAFGVLVKEKLSEEFMFFRLMSSVREKKEEMIKFLKKYLPP